jgi:hypothetical protein
LVNEGEINIIVTFYGAHKKIKSSKFLFMDKKHPAAYFNILNTHTDNKVTLINDSSRIYSNIPINQQIVQNISSTGQGVYFLGVCYQKQSNWFSHYLNIRREKM